jgi:lipopolysaccharide transport system ATP-binding protein
MEDSSVFEKGKSWEGSYRLKLRLPALWLEPGLYSVHFKVFLRTQRQSARYVSDIFHLDVGGVSAGCGSMLNPEATWSLDEEVSTGGAGGESALEQNVVVG